MKKTLIIKILLLTLILIIPIVYFTYVNYIIISSYTASNIAGIASIEDNALKAFNLMGIYNLEYILYCLLIILNYFLYQKKCLKSLLITNITILCLFTITILVKSITFTIPYDLLIYLIASIFGLGLSLTLKHKKTNS